MWTRIKATFGAQGPPAGDEEWTGSPGRDGPLFSPCNSAFHGLRSTNSSDTADSGYGSLMSVPSSSEHDSAERQLSTGTRRLKMFEMEVPEAAQQRLYDWKVLFTPQLRNLLYKYHDPGADLSMRLKFLGPSEADAKLYLVFQCDGKVAKALQKFLAQKHVTDQFQSQFEYLVIARQPKRLAKEGESIPVQSPVKYPQQRDTLCGMPITIINKDGPATATIGGTLIVKTESRRFLCCMTAGHAVTRLFCSAPRRDIAKAGERDSPNTSIYGSLMAFDENGEIELDLPDFAAFDMAIPENQDQGEGHQQHHIGSLIGVPAETAGQPTNLDWALVELCQPNYLPNLCQLSSACKQPLIGLETPRPSARPVLVLSQRGNLHGVMRRQESSFLPVGGESFTVVYDLVLNSSAGT